MIAVDLITGQNLDANVIVKRQNGIFYEGRLSESPLLSYNDELYITHAGYLPLLIDYQNIPLTGIVSLHRNDMLQPVTVSPKKKNVSVFVLLGIAFLIYKFY